MTEAAEADLSDIWMTIALDASEQIATRMVMAIKSVFDRLRDFPFLVRRGRN